MPRQQAQPSGCSGCSCLMSILLSIVLSVVLSVGLSLLGGWNVFDEVAPYLPWNEQNGELSEEQRAAWERARNQAGRRGYQLAACLHPSGQWTTSTLTKDGNLLWHHGMPANQKTGGYWSTSLDNARSTAQASSARPEIRAVAVLDMFSQSDPRVLEWWRDEGKGPVPMQTAPTEELGDGLSRFLQSLQKDPSK